MHKPHPAHLHAHTHTRILMHAWVYPGSDVLPEYTNEHQESGPTSHQHSISPATSCCSHTHKKGHPIGPTTSPAAPSAVAAHIRKDACMAELPLAKKHLLLVPWCQGHRYTQKDACMAELPLAKKHLLLVPWCQGHRYTHQNVLNTIPYRLLVLPQC